MADSSRKSKRVPSWMGRRGVSLFQRQHARGGVDLGLGFLIQASASTRRYVPFVRQTLTTLVTDPSVLAWRQATLADFLANPALIRDVQALLPRLAELRHGHHPMLGQRKRNVLMETTDRLAELDVYVSVVQDLHALLQQADLHAEALRRLRDDVLAVVSDERFQALREELP